MITENSQEIEEQVMAEIRSALNLSTIQSPESKGSRSTTQKVSVSPQESTTAATDEDESCEFYGSETFVRVKEGTSSSNRNSAISLDGSSLHDSFLDHLNVSYTSSIAGSASTGTNESSYHKFYIGTVSEETEDCSIQSHISDLGTDELSHGELMDAVQRLYKQLKQAEDSLSSERKKRRSREKNLIKLAKELGKRKNASNKLLDKIAEVSLDDENVIVRDNGQKTTQKLATTAAAQCNILLAIGKSIVGETAEIPESWHSRSQSCMAARGRPTN
jgi:predicted RNA-binding protein with PIN domain